MKKIKSFLILFIPAFSFAQLNVVPMPAEANVHWNVKAKFNINSNTVVIYNSKKIEQSIHYLLDQTKKLFGISLRSKFNPIDFKKEQVIPLNSIVITLLDESFKNDKGDEYYDILSSTKSMTIMVNAPQGCFYSIQTLLQLFSDNFSNRKIDIPILSIKDYPRFPYRGMHLDVARHFFTVAQVKKYIDYLAAYKFNTFHWHLTDDQGWRIAINKYPELTKVGAQRNGTLIGRYPGKGNDNKPYGGFYTQKEIKEVIQYAKERYIDVIPEIEMPGHSSAAIAAYPWLSCFPNKPTEMPANMMAQESKDEQKAGRIKLVQETWGVFDDVFCAGKDSTFTFLENVLNEVSSLFPSKYIHIGGDESPKTHWKICPACQKRMKDNNLKDEHELQSWFIQRIEKYLNSKGKTIIGWDEILEGGLAPNAVVMSWRGEKGGIEAAKQKHQVIMTPGNPLYFDYTQSKNEDSITFGGYNPIENVYAYEPVAKELNVAEGKYILGAQANMWTEYQSNPSKIEYQLFPRITALSEVLWSLKEKRDWKDFEKRLPFIFERLDAMGINYSKAYYDLKATVMPADDNEGILVKLESNLSGTNIRYRYNSSEFSNYSQPIALGKNVELSFSIFKNNEPVRLSSQKFSFNKATGKKITLTTPPSKNYPGNGAFTLVDGIQNTKGLSRSSEFLGFLGKDLEAIIDLGKITAISEIRIRTFTQIGSWIYPPGQSIKVMLSDDGINFSSPENEFGNIQPSDGVNKIWFSLSHVSVNTRFIKLNVPNYGIIPQGNAGAGNPAWLFVDEIEVE